MGTFVKFKTKEGNKDIAFNVDHITFVEAIDSNETRIHPASVVVKGGFSKVLEAIDPPAK